MTTMDLNKFYLNCSEVSIMDEVAYLDQFLILECDTRQKYVEKSWVMPGDVPMSLANMSALMLADGSLQIGPLKAEDSGIYTCHATSDFLNETLYVTVVVHNATKNGGMEAMKTAYTTLVGCLVSIILILIYLYLTPCRCACCPGQSLGKSVPGSFHSSTVSVPQVYEEIGGQEGAKDLLNRRVAFLDQLEQNGRLNPIGEEDEELQGDNQERRRSDAGSISSVCSDTPMVM